VTHNRALHLVAMARMASKTVVSMSQRMGWSISPRKTQILPVNDSADVDSRTYISGRQAGPVPGFNVQMERCTASSHFGGGTPVFSLVTRMMSSELGSWVESFDGTVDIIMLV